jgi:hypothetical protein
MGTLHFVHFHVFVECSSWPLMLGMFSLFCPLLGANSSTPRRHGSGQNNKNITNTRDKLEHSTKTHVFVECSSLPLVLVMFSLFCPLPCLHGVLDFSRTVSNVLIRRHGSGQNNEYITNTRCKLEHSTKTWKWTK